jgi:hypothetical protein
MNKSLPGMDLKSLFLNLLPYYVLISATIFGAIKYSSDHTPIWANFIVTSLLGIWANYYFWTRTPALTFKSLETVRLDTQGRQIILYAAAYMAADLPVLWMENYELGDSIMYTVHHLFAFISLILCLIYAKYEWFIMAMLTCEITNIFFNGQYLLAGTPYHLPCQLAFVAVFFGYRIFYLLRMAINMIYHLFKHGKYFDLFVINMGPVMGTILHFYWSYLVLYNIMLLFY